MKVNIFPKLIYTLTVVIILFGFGENLCFGEDSTSESADDEQWRDILSADGASVDNKIDAFRTEVISSCDKSQNTSKDKVDCYKDQLSNKLGAQSNKPSETEAPLSSEASEDTQNATNGFDAFEECSQDYTNALPACDPDENHSIRKYSMGLAEIMLPITAMASTNINLVCSKMGEVAAGANVALIGFRGYCSYRKDSCIDGCSKAIKYLSNVSPGSADYQLASEQLHLAKTYNRECTKLNTKIQQANMALGNLMQLGMQSLSCSQKTGNDLFKEFCEKNPTGVGCEPADCSGTLATTNPVCICQKDPQGAACLAATGRQKPGASSAQNQNAGGTGGSVAGDNLKDASDAELKSLIDGLASTEEITPRSGGTQAATPELGGKKGGGANLGGGSDSGGGGKKPGGGGAPESAGSPLAGFYGAGSGSNSFGGAASKGTRTPSGMIMEQNGQLRKPNLKDFLPGGLLDPRNRSSLLGEVGQDGLTGPNSDLWKKIKFRYRMQEATLLSN